MTNHCIKRIGQRTLTSTMALLFCALAASAWASGPSDPGWPRTFADQKAELVVYQPQVETWSEYKTLNGRCAFTVRRPDAGDPVYGTFRFSGETLVDLEKKLVLLRAVKKFDMRLQGVAKGEREAWIATAERLLPTDALILSLDRVVASLQAAATPPRETKVRSEAPPIFVRTHPAVLVILDGPPVLAELQNSKLRRVINTNWPLYHDPQSGAYYLSYEQTWLKSPSLEGSFLAQREVPRDLLRPELAAPATAASDGNPRPGKVEVILSQKPAELIVIDGAPKLESVADTTLFAVVNTESDLFYESQSKSYYFLTSGRWFQSAATDGAWRYASQELPATFRAIPAEHPRAHVLASVPGTREAEDAVLLASIPRKSSLPRTGFTAETTYAGAPEFTWIEGTKVAYAKNTQNDVFRIGNYYYLCLQGAWFYSLKPTGPWEIAERVPEDLYAIPESSSKHHVTYVRVYDATPNTVVVGYTSGYVGSYVSNGVVVWGTGYYYAPYVSLRVGVAPVYWGAGAYTYGASTWYNPATGVYARGSAVYGPYGGYGAGAAYHAPSGTYAQGVGVWGPNGGAGAARTYNPSTGVSSAGYRAANPNSAWGEGAVSNGSDWARGGYRAGSQGAVAAGETSKGGAGIAATGPEGNRGYLAKSGDGDLYAGANGNVYKREEDQWYRKQEGGWSSVEKAEVEQQRQQAMERNRGSRNAEASERWASRQGGNASSPRGVERRPQIQGRRR